MSEATTTTTAKAPAKKAPAKPAVKKAAKSPAAKEAMALGQERAKAVRAYLTALDDAKPKRGRTSDPAKLREKLANVDAHLNAHGLGASALPVMERLSLIQKRADLAADLEAVLAEPDLTELEAAFTKHAEGFSEAKGISWATWRTMGVSADVLKAAGIKPRS